MHLKWSSIRVCRGFDANAIVVGGDLERVPCDWPPLTNLRLRPSNMLAPFNHGFFSSPRHSRPFWSRQRILFPCEVPTNKERAPCRTCSVSFQVVGKHFFKCFFCCDCACQIRNRSFQPQHCCYYPHEAHHWPQIQIPQKYFERKQEIFWGLFCRRHARKHGCAPISTGAWRALLRWKRAELQLSRLPLSSGRGHIVAKVRGSQYTRYAGIKQRQDSSRQS